MKLLLQEDDNHHGETIPCASSMVEGEQSLTKSLQECFACPSTQLARELSGAREKVCSMLPLQHGKIEKRSR